MPKTVKYIKVTIIVKDIYQFVHDYAQSGIICKNHFKLKSMDDGYSAVHCYMVESRNYLNDDNIVEVKKLG